jgi:hypothetical protein
MIITCKNGHKSVAPVLIPGKGIPTFTCWKCVAGVK